MTLVRLVQWSSGLSVSLGTDTFPNQSTMADQVSLVKRGEKRHVVILE